MTIFYNTENGIYDFDDYGRKGAYTFPVGAYVNLNGVKLDISGIKVECFGGKFDGGSVDFFTKYLSKLPSYSKNIINSDIFIIDCAIYDGYADREYFEKYKIPYIHPTDFLALKKEAENLPDSHPDNVRIKAVDDLFLLSKKDSVRSLQEQIESILNQTHSYPLSISILYDDRLKKHTSHVVLQYHSRNECTLNIDNTLSLVSSAKNLVELIKTQHQLDITTAKESFSSSKPNFIKFHNKNNPGAGDIELEMDRPVSKMLFDGAYKRMATILKDILQIPIKNVHINSCLTQKTLECECVPFSLQNKINFISNDMQESNESLIDLAIRTRAQHAILVYLLSANQNIPQYNEIIRADFSLPDVDDVWYPDFDLVCKELKQRISQLPVESLEDLLASMDLDGFSLAYSFKPLIIESLKSKMNAALYTEIPCPQVSEIRATDIEAVLAPSVLYQNSSHTFFLKKSAEPEFNKEALLQFVL